MFTFVQLPGVRQPTTLSKKIQSTIDKTHLFCTGVQSINVEQRLKFDTAILAFKAINKISPDYICDEISLTSAHHTTILDNLKLTASSKLELKINFHLNH